MGVRDVKGAADEPPRRCAIPASETNSKGAVSGAPFSVAGKDLNLRPPGYEPPRLCTRVPPWSAEMQAPEPGFGRGRAFRRNTVTSQRKQDACKTLQAQVAER